MSELKPCPFCQGRAFFKEDPAKIPAYCLWIECEDCHVGVRTTAISNLNMPGMRELKTKLQLLWNTRANE